MTEVKGWVDKAAQDGEVTHVVIIEEMDISECYPKYVKPYQSVEYMVRNIDTTCCVRLVVDMSGDIAQQLATAGYVSPA